MENRIQTDDSGLIWYNGKAYQYNENVITILVMGIDQNSEEIQQIEGISGESGQADSIFLLVMDESKNKVRIIGMSRDTMTPIKTFDYKGNYVGDAEIILDLPMHSEMEKRRVVSIWLMQFPISFMESLLIHMWH